MPSRIVMIKQSHTSLMLDRLYARARPDHKKVIRTVRGRLQRSLWRRHFDKLAGQGETFELTREDREWIHADLTSPLA